VQVTNMHAQHGPAMSEAALSFMLALGRDLPRTVRSNDRHAWERWPPNLLAGKTVGIFGVGTSAAELAPKCKAMGMTVVGITSTRRAVPGFDRMHRREELIAVVRELDYLVLLTPYSPATHRIIDAKVLGAMKPTGYLQAPRSTCSTRSRCRRSIRCGRARTSSSRRIRPGTTPSTTSGRSL
jgi:D-2-hydroxyacid dehydrogenase (NADP+)